MLHQLFIGAILFVGGSFQPDFDILKEGLEDHCGSDAMNDFTNSEKQLYMDTIHRDHDEIEKMLASTKPKTLAKLKAVWIAWGSMWGKVSELSSKLIEYHEGNVIPSEVEKEEFAKEYFSLRPKARKFFAEIYNEETDSYGYSAEVVEYFNEHFGEACGGAEIKKIEKRDEL